MDTKRLQTLAGILKEGYMGTPYASSEDMAVDMIKKGITREGDSWHPDDPADTEIDDTEEDPDDYDDVSENEADSESGNTNAMGGIDEAGNVKGIKIEIPGNSYASDFGKAAAREVIESFGPREYRNFLEAFLNEFKKLTGGV